MQKLLGSGGMGVVYQAFDHDLNIEIALKVIRLPAPGPKAALSIIEIQRRLRNELVLARQITHRNVIRIHDIGEIEGIRFISMPLVKGPDLATVLQGGRLRAARALRYARHIAAGLVAVHAAGVIHRDIKPGNIMIDADDQAVVMDFGVARSSAPATRQGTVSASIAGTPAYMAPEQARGEAVDQRTDVYAFGLVLYEMLTGPRADLSMSDLAARMKAAPPPAHRVNPRVPRALEEIATKCLQPSREARYQTSAELAAALASLGRRAVRENPVPGARGGWMKYAAALLLAGVLASAVYALTRIDLGSFQGRQPLARLHAAALSQTRIAWSIPREAVLGYTAPAPELPWYWRWSFGRLAEKGFVPVHPSCSSLGLDRSATSSKNLKTGGPGTRFSRQA